MSLRVRPPVITSLNVMPPITPSKPFRQRAEEAFLRTVRAYTFNTPVKKGTYRLFTQAMKMCKHPHTSLLVTTADGRSLYTDLTSGMEDTVFFHGRYEPVLTDIVRGLVGPGDTCIDAGPSKGCVRSRRTSRSYASSPLMIPAMRAIALRPTSQRLPCAA